MCRYGYDSHVYGIGYIRAYVHVQGQMNTRLHAWIENMHVQNKYHGIKIVRQVSAHARGRCLPIWPTYKRNFRTSTFLEVVNMSLLVSVCDLIRDVIIHKRTRESTNITSRPKMCRNVLNLGGGRGGRRENIGW